MDGRYQVNSTENKTSDPWTTTYERPQDKQMRSVMVNNRREAILASRIAEAEQDEHLDDEAFGYAKGLRDARAILNGDWDER
jgi:hypothetical protein